MREINIEYIDINKLKPSEYNPRKADEKQYNDLKESIKEYGLVDPIIVNKAEGRENRIIGGHFRIRIAKDMGIEKVPVIYVDIPDLDKERELNLRLNKNLGSWDWDLLANFDEDILMGVGFDEKEIETALALSDMIDFDKMEQDLKDEIASDSEKVKLEFVIPIDKEQLVRDKLAEYSDDKNVALVLFCKDK